MIKPSDSQRRVAAIHDISGFGRCSLTVIIPTLSAMGVQTCPVPTAVLSTHTGGLGEVAMRDLTDFIPAALDHYKRFTAAFWEARRRSIIVWNFSKRFPTLWWWWTL